MTTDDHCTTRLRFNGRHGVAKKHGVLTALSVGPDLGCGPVWAMDYVPENGVRVVQPRSVDRPRDMTPDEVRTVDELLHKLADIIL